MHDVNIINQPFGDYFAEQVNLEKIFYVPTLCIKYLKQAFSNGGLRAKSGPWCP